MKNPQNKFASKKNFDKIYTIIFDEKKILVKYQCGELLCSF